MEGQVTDVEQEVIITKSNLLLHFSGYNNGLLVLKQWKGALNRIMLSPLGLLKNNDLALRARSLFLRRPRSSGIILYILPSWAKIKGGIYEKKKPRLAESKKGRPSLLKNKTCFDRKRLCVVS